MTDRKLRVLPGGARVAAALAALLAMPSAHASFLSGEALDTAANVLSWVILLIVPPIVIGLFWIVHVLPEKIAEKRHHPNKEGIHVLCLLSLVFGGMLWPFAWLWAYTKPVLHKMAYGTDVDESHGHGNEEVIDEKKEIEKLRARVAELEAKSGSGRS